MLYMDCSDFSAALLMHGGLFWAPACIIVARCLTAFRCFYATSHQPLPLIVSAISTQRSLNRNSPLSRNVQKDPITATMSSGLMETDTGGESQQHVSPNGPQLCALVTDT